SCFIICDEILPRWGVETVFVDGDDTEQWREALSVPTDAVFFESPSNPMQELVDVRAVCDLAHEAGAQVVVDNVFATVLHQKPLELGADVVVYSTTKHIDGQGRVLGGAVLGTEEYISGPVKKLMRHAGFGMSAFNAWVLLKGLETMGLRLERMSANALAVAEFLDGHDAVEWVRYPMLPTHPQYELARRQMSGGGSVVTFGLSTEGVDDGGKRRCFDLLNALQVIDISNNLGDAKSLITHPATTTHASMEPEARAHVGITDNAIRFSVGLEYAGDLIDDLRRGRCAAQASSPARATSIGQPSVTCPSVTGASGAMLTSMHSVTGAPAVVRVPPGSVAGYPAVEASTGLGVVRSPSRRLREPLSKVGAAHVPWLDSTARMRRCSARAAAPSRRVPASMVARASSREPTAVRKVIGS